VVVEIRDLGKRNIRLLVVAEVGGTETDCLPADPVTWSVLA
jgi:hypothetical protein